MSQDEARVPRVPTRAAPLGVKGHRPTVGTRDGKDLLDVFAVVHRVWGALPSNPLESPKDAKRPSGKSQRRRLQEAFAAPRRHVGKAYPREKHPRVVLRIDNAPWQRGGPVSEALGDNPHPELKRLPPCSPQRNPSERFGKALRRRAPPKRLFETRADLKRSVRDSLSYVQTRRGRIKSLLKGRDAR